MLDDLQVLPADPILGLMAKYREDVRAHKIDLGVGVYKDDLGQTPVLASIKEAERRLLSNEQTKAYVGPAGNENFNNLLTELILGRASAITEGNVAAVQTPGGCGALRVLAELIKVAAPGATIWVSDPTWDNHIPLLGNCGLDIRTYPYYDQASSSIDFAAMIEGLEQAQRGDLVLLHGCCHNPSGADLSLSQWHAVTEFVSERRLVPFVDVAYQGFGDGVEEDVAGLRHLVEVVPETLIAVSCSKNFGLYRERVGLALVVANSRSALAAKTHLLSIIRGIYSMPPDHGAALVAGVLGDEVLRAQWLQEVSIMRERIACLRTQFSDGMLHRLGHDHFRFVQKQKGMFSFLGLSAEHVTHLRQQFAIYMLDSSRASIAGLRSDNIDAVCDAIADVYQSGTGFHSSLAAR